jgi:hypothetical protein
LKREVQTQIEKVVSLADAERRRSFWAFERKLWTQLLAVGRAMVTLFPIRQALRPRPAEYVHEGRHLLLSAERTSAIGSRFGKVTFTRPRHLRVEPEPARDAEDGRCRRRGGESIPRASTSSRRRRRSARHPGRWPGSADDHDEATLREARVLLERVVRMLTKMCRVKKPFTSTSTRSAAREARSRCVPLETGKCTQLRPHLATIAEGKVRPRGSYDPQRAPRDPRERTLLNVLGAPLQP